ncbi:MAG: nuclear transport factor 2 family protein [Bacteroidota bacterium]
MKSTFFFLCMTLMYWMAPTQSQAQQSDYEQVVKVLEDYMIGGTERDAKRVASAFHTEAQMKFIRQGNYQAPNAATFFREGIKPGPKVERKCEIALLDISGHAAMAKLRLIYADKIFNDYMTLLKINGRWQIVNKSFYLEMVNDH